MHSLTLLGGHSNQQTHRQSAFECPLNHKVDTDSGNFKEIKMRKKKTESLHTGRMQARQEEVNRSRPVHCGTCASTDHPRPIRPGARSAALRGRPARGAAS